MTLVYLSIAWLAGIALARTLSIPWQFLILMGLASLVGLMGWKGSNRFRLGCVCLVMLALGGGRLLLSQPRPDEMSLLTYNNIGRVSLEGVVAEEPDEREFHTNLRLRAETLVLQDGQVREVSGSVLVRIDRYPAYAYGDRLQVIGLLETPPEFVDFSYRDYLARQGVHSLMREVRVTRVGGGEGSPVYAALLGLKLRARVTIARILPEPAASLLTGILLGTETGIPPDLMEDFSATGTTHIIAISGFNITIVANIIAGMARRLVGEKRSTWVAIGGVALYTIFVGASAAVVRAAIMGGLYLLAKHLGRETFAPVSLGAAAIVMTAINPYTLWDLGFQLSVAATAGLILYTKSLERGAERLLRRITSERLARRTVSWFSEALLVTLSAQLTTLPLLMYHFRQLSLVTLLTNFLILPIQPMVMVCGAAATLAGMVWLPIGRLFGWGAWLFLAYTIEMVRLTARVPFAWVNLVQVSGWMVWGFYGLLGGMTWWGYQTPERRAEMGERVRMIWLDLTARMSDRAMLACSAFLLILATATWRALPDGRLHVHFLDVGQGDAVFVETPSGRQVLIDGGPSPTRLLSHLGKRMGFWDHTLDLVILSHPDDDVLAGLIPVLERYEVGGVLARDLGCQAGLCIQMEELLEETGVPVWRGEVGLQVVLDEGVLLTVLHPGPDLWRGGMSSNDNSLVLRLDYGQVCFLLAGDIGGEVEEYLMEQGAWLECVVLKAAHHGDAGSTSEVFLEAVGPEVVVISVGEGNVFHHPHGQMLERAEGLQVLRTDEVGTVEVVSDGRTCLVEIGR
jgi:competence protein ComEC